MIMGKVYVMGLESDSYWNIPWQGKNLQCVNHKIIETNTKRSCALAEVMIREEKKTPQGTI